jgi:TRAP-type C4-dicarboxylate transport system permease small subunit
MKSVRWFIDNFEEVFMTIALSVITVAMFAQVLSRYVFGFTIIWAEELSRYSVILLTFTGFSFGIKKSEHLRLDILDNYFPKLKTPLMIFGDLAIAAFMIYMIPPLISLVQLAHRTGQTSPAMHIPFYIVYLPLVFGFTVGLLRTVEKYVKFFLENKRTDKKAGGM